MKYFCVTEAIAVYLQKYTIFRKRKMFFSPAGKMEDLLGIITKHNKERFIIPVSDVNKNNVVKLPGRSKLKYTNAVMYRTVSNDFTEDEAFDYDVLLFFSPAGVSSLLKNFPDYKQGETVIGSFGMATAKAIRDAGLRLDIEAPNPDAPSMATALEQYIKTVVKTGEN
jgi:uroporphyrinogen-III synthase